MAERDDTSAHGRVRRRLGDARVAAIVGVTLTVAAMGLAAWVAQPATALVSIGTNPGASQVPPVVYAQPGAERLTADYPAVIAGHFEFGSAGVAAYGGQLTDDAVFDAQTGGSYAETQDSGANTGASGAGFGFDDPTIRGGDWLVHGDFSGNNLTDIAYLPVNGANFTVGLANSTGGFNVVSSSAGPFTGWLGTPGATVVAGDFNGDGKTDIALVGGQGWTTTPIALSNGDGTFTISNVANPTFAGWSAQSGAKPIVGDFNGDGKSDIALTGVSGWTTIPMATSNGDGSFTVTNTSSPSISGWAQNAVVQVLTGDFNGDGKTDIALTGVPDWTTIPMATSNGDGSFTVSNVSNPDFAGWAAQRGAKPVVGDFNGDGKSDIALTGAPGWTTIPLAFSNGDGSFNLTNDSSPTFAGWATDTDTRVIAEDLDGDGKTDLALTGAAGWTTVPTALSNGDGSFAVSNPATPFAVTTRFNPGTTTTTTTTTTTKPPTSSSAPSIQHASGFTVVNCDSTGSGPDMGDTRSVWVDDLTANTGFKEGAILQGLPSGELCGVDGVQGQNTSFSATNGHTYQVKTVRLEEQTATNTSCGTDSPVSGCVEINQTFVGDSSAAALHFDIGN